MKPKVSIVIPAYNAENTLSETIESVLQQTFTNYELIIVNDGSEDSTEKIAKKYSRKNKQVKVISQKNQGPAAARNNGFKNSNGKYLIWVDADDLWLPSRLKVLVSFLDKNQTYDLATTDAYLWYPPEKPKQKYYSNIKNTNKLDFQNLLKTNFVFTSTLMRKIVFEKTKGLDPDRKLISVEDYEFWLRVLYDQFRIKIIKKPLVWYRQSSTSLSAQALKQNLALYHLFTKIERKLKLSPFDQETINLRKQKIASFIAQELANQGKYSESIIYYSKNPSLWSKTSKYLIKNKFFNCWKALNIIKKSVSRIKR